MTGMIFTFYSYKGGVGRTMALANIGMSLYKQGYNVLLIDWDLEAPGLERYFEESFDLELSEVSGRSGLIDMIQDYMDNMASPAEDTLSLPYPPVEEYLYALDEPFQRLSNRLLLLHAGRRGKGKLWNDYAASVQNFNWLAFYDDWGGGRYLEWLRNRFKEEFDIVLIDSRTGVTEMGGVATQHLADVVVLLCGANFENIENTARMARNFLSDAVQSAREGRVLDIMIVPSRIDDADSDGFSKFLEKMYAEFEEIPMRVLDDGYPTLETMIPYLPALSYRETLIVDRPELEKASRRITDAYRKIAANMLSLRRHKDSSTLHRPSGSQRTEISVLLISSSYDHEIVDRVNSDLRANNIQVHEISGNIPDLYDFERELAQYTCVIVVMSESSRLSTGISRWIRMVVDIGTPTIPVLTDHSSLPFALADLQYIDLKTSYSDGIVRLLMAIRDIKNDYVLTDAIPDRVRTREKLVYLSYSRVDVTIATDIRRGLERNSDYDTWTDEEIVGGRRWMEEIEEALKSAIAMIVLLSPESMQSEWVQRDVGYMQALSKPIIPVVIRGARLPLVLLDSQAIYFDDNVQGIYEITFELVRALNRITDGT